MRYLKEVISVMVPPGGAFSEGGIDVGLYDRLKELLKDSFWGRLALYLLLFFFNLLPIITLYSPFPFTMLSKYKKGEFLKKLEGSRFSLLRNYFLLIKLITIPAFYIIPEINEKLGYKTECEKDEGRY